MPLRCGSVGAPPVLERISFEEANEQESKSLTGSGAPLGRPFDGGRGTSANALSHRSHSASGSSPRRILFDRWLIANGTAAEGHRTPDGMSTSSGPTLTHVGQRFTRRVGTIAVSTALHGHPLASPRAKNSPTPNFQCAHRRGRLAHALQKLYRRHGKGTSGLHWSCSIAACWRRPAGRGRTPAYFRLQRIPVKLIHSPSVGSSCGILHEKV
jgi:hypothetical protein